MGSSGHFYSCMCLVIRDIGFPQVDGLSTDPRDLGLHNFGSLRLNILVLEEYAYAY